jgi:hypothetical protein
VPDETTPDPGNSVENAAAQIDWDSPENPYLKRFTDTQASFTTNQQRLKELERYESDPQAFLELGKQQGWIEVDEPDAGQQDTDPSRPARPHQRAGRTGVPDWSQDDPGRDQPVHG